MFNKLKNLNIIRLFKLQKAERQMIVLATIALFIVVNVLIAPFAFRADFSYGKAYTLSDSTKNILHKTNDVVNIKFYVSSDIPTRLIPLKNDVTDLLNEYKKEGGNKINVKIVDPNKDKQAANEVQQYNIPQLQFSQLEQDKYAVSAAYFGIAVIYGTKQEVIPQVTDVESLEYNLTAAIYKLTRKDLPKIGIVGLAPIDVQQDPMANIRKVMSQQFTVEQASLTTSTNLKSFATLIVVDDDKTTYSSDQLKMLSDYINNGGKVLFFVDGVWIGQNITTAPANHNLFSLLANYGIKENQDFVLSQAAELVNFGNGGVNYFTPYPYWIKTNSFNDKTSYFSNINQITFPWTSSLTIQKKANIQTTDVAYSLKESWNVTKDFNLNPQNIEQPNSSQFKQFLLAAEAKNSKGGTIIVVPSSRFIQDNFLSSGSDNVELVLNMLNDLASGGALSGIRSRAVNFYPLPNLSENEKDVFRYSNILVLPVLFGLYGAYRLLKRR